MRSVDYGFFHRLAKPLRLRHLPLFEVPVWIELSPKRYRCLDCDQGPTATQQPEWYERRSPQTKTYEQWLLRMLINSTVIDVSRKLNLSAAQVSGVLERWIETSVNWDAFESIAVLGMDEIALKRGHRDFVAIITTKTAAGVQVLAILNDRLRETVLAFLATIPDRLKATIETVCTDMYQGYVTAVQEVLPKARIVVDRFHVARADRDCADAVRKSELKRLKRELPEADFARLKSAMWPFRKRPANLNKVEKQLLNRLFVQSPELEQAYVLREELTAIFERNYTKDQATEAIQAWGQRVRNRQISEFGSFLTTVDNWLDEITNYFLELFQRLTLDVNGYQRFGPECYI
jgi:transposase